jgi:hypothetical protein
MCSFEMRHRCMERWGQRGGGERKREEDAAAAVPCAGIWESGDCVDVDWCAVCPWPWRRGSVLHHGGERSLTCSRLAARMVPHIVCLRVTLRWFTCVPVCACVLVCMALLVESLPARYRKVLGKLVQRDECSTPSPSVHRLGVSDADGSSASLLCSPARVAPAAFVGPGRLVAAHTGTCPARPPCRGRLGAAA